jgi:hypothetical protein
LRREVFGLLEIIEVLTNLLRLEQSLDFREECRQFGGELWMVFRCLYKVEKLLADEIVQSTFHPVPIADTLGCFALFNPDLVELNR